MGQSRFRRGRAPNGRETGTMPEGAARNATRLFRVFECLENDLGIAK